MCIATLFFFPIFVAELYVNTSLFVKKRLLFGNVEKENINKTINNHDKKTTFIHYNAAMRSIFISVGRCHYQHYSR